MLYRRPHGRRPRGASPPTLPQNSRAKLKEPETKRDAHPGPSLGGLSRHQWVARRKPPAEPCTDYPDRDVEGYSRLTAAGIRPTEPSSVSADRVNRQRAMPLGRSQKRKKLEPRNSA
jgi:hypothetical protein